MFASDKFETIDLIWSTIKNLFAYINYLLTEMVLIFIWSLRHIEAFHENNIRQRLIICDWYKRIMLVNEFIHNI